MKPTLDEEIRRIAKEAAAQLHAGTPYLVIESAIYAGIEAWKRQEPTLGMLMEAVPTNPLAAMIVLPPSAKSSNLWNDFTAPDQRTGRGRRWMQ